MEFNFFDKIMETFTNLSISGTEALLSPALSIAFFLGIIEMTTMWGMYFGEMRIREITGKALKIAFFALLIMQWGTLSVAVQDSFIKAGQLASGTTVAATPSSIMASGFDKSFRLWNNALYDIPMEDGKTATTSSLKDVPYYDENGQLNRNADGSMLKTGSKSFTEKLAAIPMQLTKIGLSLFIILAFFFIAIQVLICWLEFLITSTLATILIPFGVSNHTSFISQKAIGATVNFGIKLMILTFLMGIVGKFIDNMGAITSDSWSTIFGVTLEAVTYSFLIYTIPGMVSGMLSGSPSLSSGDLKQATQQAVQMALAVKTGGLSTIRSPYVLGRATYSGAKDAKSGYQSKRTSGSSVGKASAYATYAGTSTFLKTAKKHW